jgi:diguanylate cyclase (GGDEF)-like protein
VRTVDPNHPDFFPAMFNRDTGDTTEIIMTGEEATIASAQKARDRGTVTLIAGPAPGTIFTVDAEVLVFGRGSSASAPIDDRALSRAHARIVRVGGSFWIEDLGSTNGTWLNEEILQRRERLATGDRIRLGMSTMLRFELHDLDEQAAAKRLYESAVKDPLTQVYNRRHLDERMNGEHAYAARHETDLTVLLVDIDHFKSVNDSFGHPAGDAVIRIVAATMQRIVRTEDLVARYGGEEFCVVARGIDARNSEILAERLRRTVEGLSIPLSDRNLRVTVSIGVATFDRTTTYPLVGDLLKACDDALYAAKREGRNRVRHASRITPAAPT